MWCVWLCCWWLHLVNRGWILLIVVCMVWNLLLWYLLFEGQWRRVVVINYCLVLINNWLVIIINNINIIMYPLILQYTGST